MNENVLLKDSQARRHESKDSVHGARGAGILGGA